MMLMPAAPSANARTRLTSTVTTASSKYFAITWRDSAPSTLLKPTSFARVEAIAVARFT